MFYSINSNRVNSFFDNLLFLGLLYVRVRIINRSNVREIKGPQDMSAKPSFERFKSDIKDHRMTINHEDGVYRSITFGRANSWTYRFTITTWPGYLAITGDCGSYVFARLRDMFEFFDDVQDDPHGINPGYWGEKLQSIDKHGGYERFSGDLLAGILRDWIKEHVFEDDDEKDALLQELEDHHFGVDVESYADAQHLIEEVRLISGCGEFKFDDLWDYRTEDYTYHFIWCCRAIRWAVRQYRLGGDPISRQEKSTKLILSGKA